MEPKPNLKAFDRLSAQTEDYETFYILKISGKSIFDNVRVTSSTSRNNNNNSFCRRFL